MADDASMQDGLERLLAEAACRRLVLQSAQAMDQRQYPALSALFTPDGVLVRPGREPAAGRPAIEASYAGRPPERITRHVVTSTLLTFDGPHRARGLSPVLVWIADQQDAEGPQGRPTCGPRLLGEFEDEFVRLPEGWRIARRESRFVLHTA